MNDRLIDVVLTSEDDNTVTCTHIFCLTTTALMFRLLLTKHSLSATHTCIRLEGFSKIAVFGCIFDKKLVTTFSKHNLGVLNTKILITKFKYEFYSF